MTANPKRLFVTISNAEYRTNAVRIIVSTNLVRSLLPYVADKCLVADILRIRNEPVLRHTIVAAKMGMIYSIPSYAPHESLAAQGNP